MIKHFIDLLNKLRNNPLFCNHHYEGYVFNGTGGSHIICKKCGYEHYGHISDFQTQKALKKIQKEKSKEKLKKE